MLLEHRSLTQPTVIGMVVYGWTSLGIDEPTLAVAVDRSKATRTAEVFITAGVPVEYVETSDTLHIDDHACLSRGMVAVYVLLRCVPDALMQRIRKKHGEPLREWAFEERIWDLPEVPEEDRIEPFVPSRFQLSLFAQDRRKQYRARPECFSPDYVEVCHALCQDR
mgnify:CR=1 FL=1